MSGRQSDDERMGKVINILQARGGSTDEFVSRLSAYLRAPAGALSRDGCSAGKIWPRTWPRRRTSSCIRLSRPSEVTVPRAYLFDVATKLALDRLRQKRAEAAAMGGEPAEMNEVPDEAPRPERRVLLDEAMQRLTRIIEELQPSLRQVFVMRYVTQMPRQEIADKLHISVGAVEQRLTRALTHCRERLTAHGIDWVGLE